MNSYKIEEIDVSESSSKSRQMKINSLKKRLSSVKNTPQTRTIQFQEEKNVELNLFKKDPGSHSPLKMSINHKSTPIESSIKKKKLEKEQMIRFEECLEKANANEVKA